MQGLEHIRLQMQEQAQGRHTEPVAYDRALIIEMLNSYCECVDARTHESGAVISQMDLLAAAAKTPSQPVARDVLMALAKSVEYVRISGGYAVLSEAQLSQIVDAQLPAVADMQAKLEEAEHHRDCLARAIRNAAVKAGIIRADAVVEGPQLLMLADNLGEAAMPPAVAVPGVLTALSDLLAAYERIKNGGRPSDAAERQARAMLAAAQKGGK